MFEAAGSIRDQRGPITPTPRSAESKAVDSAPFARLLTLIKWSGRDAMAFM